MASHPCPFTAGELMALYAIAACRGNATLAARLLEHSREHEGSV